MSLIQEYKKSNRFLIFSIVNDDDLNWHINDYCDLKLNFQLITMNLKF